MTLLISAIYPVSSLKRALATLPAMIRAIENRPYTQWVSSMNIKPVTQRKKILSDFIPSVRKRTLGILFMTLIINKLIFWHAFWYYIGV